MIDPSAAVIAPSAVCAAAVTGGGSRPMRHAAVRAANRTVAFARTGAFPAEEGVVVMNHEGGRYRTQQEAISGGGASEADDSCHNSSDSAEDELLYHRAAGIGGVGPGSPIGGGSGAALLSSGSGSMLELTHVMGGGAGGGSSQGGEAKGTTGLAVDVKMALGVDRTGALTPASADLSALGLASAHQSSADLFQMPADGNKVWDNHSS